jgi:hypothetical protein
MTLPSENDIRTKYNITQPNSFTVEQRNSIPLPTEAMLDCSRLDKQGFWNGFEVWLKTTILGSVVLSVIFVGEISDGIQAIQNIGNLIYTNKATISYYADHFADYAKDKAIGFLAHTDNPPTEEDKQFQQWAIFPTGVSLYPASGEWRPS